MTGPQVRRAGINTRSRRAKRDARRDCELSMARRRKEKNTATRRCAIGNNTMVNRAPSGPDDLAGRISLLPVL